MKLFVINDDQPKVFVSLLLFESIPFYSRLSSSMENNIDHSSSDQSHSQSVVLGSTQRSVSTTLPTVQHSSNPSVTVQQQQEREQQRKREREVVRQWHPRRQWNFETYEEYLQTQLEHYLETENVEIQELENEFNEQVKRIEQVGQIKEEELQQMNDEQLQEREQFEQQQLLEQLKHLKHSPQ